MTKQRLQKTIAAVTLSLVASFPFLEGCVTRMLPETSIERYIFAGEQFEEVYTLRGERIKLHYDEIGKENSNNILLLHGIAGSTNTWKYISSSLAEKNHVLLLDLKGCGKSEKPKEGYTKQDFLYEIDQFLNQRGIEKVDIIGKSLGASIALWYNQAHPEKVNKLIHVSGYIPGATKYSCQALENIVLNMPGVKEINNFELTRLYLEAQLYDNKNLTGEMIADRYLYLKTEQGWHAFKEICKNAKKEVFEITEEDVHNASGKTLFIVPESDKIFSPNKNMLEKMKKVNSGLNYIIIKESGHLLTQEKPKELIEIITEYINN